MIEVHDNKLPFYVQQQVYNFIINSMFRIKGWEDRNDTDIKKYDLHSNWTLEDIKGSGLYPYLEAIHSFDKFDKSFWLC